MALRFVKSGEKITRMKKLSKADYATLQNRMLNQLSDRASAEAEEIIEKRLRTGADLTDEDRDKSRATSVAGSTFLDKYAEKRKKE